MVAADGGSGGSFPTRLQVTLSTLKAHGVLVTLSSSSMGARKPWELLRPQRLGSALLLMFLLALLRHTSYSSARLQMCHLVFPPALQKSIVWLLFTRAAPRSIICAEKCKRYRSNILLPLTHLPNETCSARSNMVDFVSDRRCPHSFPEVCLLHISKNVNK